MEKPFAEIDVFSADPFLGNPVAVVFDAADLDSKAMARIANWTNFSETTFVTGVEADAYDLRIFTPRGELPFAGHPSVGTAYALRRTERLSPTATDVIQRCQAGNIPVRFDSETVSVRVPPARVSGVSTAGDDVAQALGLAAVDEPLRINVGPVWVTTRVRSCDALRRIVPDDDAIARMSRDLSAVGLTVYATDEAHVEVRSFAPAEGIKEDPVCGSGNACVAAHLRHTGGLARVGTRYEARQGHALGREGHLRVQVDDQDIWIGGACVQVVSGALHLAR